MRIEIGGGRVPNQGWVNLDPVHGAAEWRRRAQDLSWPVEDGTVAAIRAAHVLEHIPAGQDRIDVFNEAHRVLSPGGTFEVIVPFLPSWQAIADPTHISFWVAESFRYFDATIAPNAEYGIRTWETLRLDVVAGWEGHWIGRPT